MQTRCRHCNRPYALKRDEIHAALDTVEAEGLKHYNAFCPHCGKANRISKKELKRGAPTWSKTQEEPNA